MEEDRTTGQVTIASRNGSNAQVLLLHMICCQTGARKGDDLQQLEDAFKSVKCPSRVVSKSSRAGPYCTVRPKTMTIG